MTCETAKISYTNFYTQIGVTRSQIEECLSGIEVVDGIDDLFEFITANGGDIVVISASFMANVECGLEGARLLGGNSLA